MEVESGEQVVTECRNACTRHSSATHLKQHFIDSWTGQACHKTSSTKLLISEERNEQSGCACDKAKGHHFEHASLSRVFFRVANSLPKTRYVSRHFIRCYLKANELSKSEGTGKVEWAHLFAARHNA